MIFLSIALLIASFFSLQAACQKPTAMAKNLLYYNTHANLSHSKTMNNTIQEGYDALLPLLPSPAHILDAGCGVGRDSKYFLNKGYQVTAFDGSQEMVRLAKQETGLPVLLMKFQEMTFTEEFDAVWAAASLLHVPYEETRRVYENIHTSLKTGGYFFGFYKYGSGTMSTQERYFWNMTEETILPYFKGLFEPLKIWKVTDTRATGTVKSPDQAWLFFLVRKK